MPEAMGVVMPGAVGQVMPGFVVQAGFMPSVGVPTLSSGQISNPTYPQVSQVTAVKNLCSQVCKLLVGHSYSNCGRFC